MSEKQSFMYFTNQANKAVYNLKEMAIRNSQF